MGFPCAGNRSQSIVRWVVRGLGKGVIFVYAIAWDELPPRAHLEAAGSTPGACPKPHHLVIVGIALENEKS